MHKPIVCVLQKHVGNIEYCASMIEENVMFKEKINTWDTTKGEEFNDRIDVNKVTEIIGYLENLDSVNISKENINHAFNEIADILIDSAKITFGTKIVQPKGSNLKGKKKHVWFDADCFKARKQYRKCKRKYKTYGSRIFKNVMTMAEKSYKLTMDKSLKNTEMV